MHCCRGLQRSLHLHAAAHEVDVAAPLRDHRPLLCNADDYSRMCAVPKAKGANYRDMPGVVTHPNKAGSKGECGTAAGGMQRASGVRGGRACHEACRQACVER